MYPEEIMTDVNWGFYGDRYNSLPEFVKAVIEYNQELCKEWIPDEIVLACTDVTIQYSCWNDGEDEETVEDFNLVADNPSGFTAAELLYKIHNVAVYNLEDEDHHFFEGLTLWDGENYSNPDAPLYFLNQGS
jgi:hypothetical protein